MFFICDSYQVATHEETIWDQIQFDFRELNILVDLGFLGIEKDQPNIIILIKEHLKMK